eukprot:3587485-Alexandrium_andersonii.AAC.1
MIQAASPSAACRFLGESGASAFRTLHRPPSAWRTTMCREQCSAAASNMMPSTQRLDRLRDRT